MTPEEARKTVTGWLSRDYWDDDVIDGYDLTPIIDDIARVEAHLDAERERIATLKQTAHDLEQARVDALPRRRYRMTRKPEPDRTQTPNGAVWLAAHRVSIDCWSGRDGHLHVDGVVHGDIIRVDGRLGFEDDPRPALRLGDRLIPMDRCLCIADAVVECTDEYLAHVRSLASYYTVAHYEFTPLEDA